jgi:hypothetical protein
MKRTLSFLILILILLLFESCNPYSDLKIIVKNNTIDICNPQIEVAVQGSKLTEGILTIKSEDTVIGLGEIQSNNEIKYSIIDLNFSNYKSNIDTLINKIKVDNELGIELTYQNDTKKININKKIRFNLKLPPISKIDITKSEKFTSIELPSDYLYRNILNNKTRIVKSDDPVDELIILKGKETFDVKILVDTLYYKTAVFSFPFYGEKELNLNFILNYINKNHTTINSDFKGITENNKFIIQKTISSDRHNKKGLFLININEQGDYFAQQIGIACFDNSFPMFYNNTRYFYDLSEEVDGIVWLETKKFSGLGIYLIPFVGKALGDIDKILVDNKPISFKLGEEFFFKQYLRLDWGYNRIPIKIIDKRGKVNETYIPVTIE